MSFPFPQLLAFLKEEKDQVEFMKVASEVGLGSGDIELAKLLVALQLYKGYYASIPRAVKTAQADVVSEIRRLRDDTKAMSDRTHTDAAVIGQWFEEIQLALHKGDPNDLGEKVHKRLLDDTLKILSGSLQAMATANGQIEAASQKMNAAARQAEASIQQWQALSLRRVWASAFAVCMGVASLISGGIWFVFFQH